MQCTVREYHVLEKFRTLFERGLDTQKGYEAAIKVEPNAKPFFSKARRVP